MEPHAPDIRYVTTTDGVQIACWSIGHGPPVIITHNLSWSHAAKEWKMKALWQFYSGLAKTNTVVRYDPRSAGVSSYEAPSMASRAMCLDIDAVADGLGFERFSLIGCSIMGPVVAEYAATRQDRVDSLIVCDAITAPGTAEAVKLLKGSVALTQSSGAEYAMDVLPAPDLHDVDDQAILKEIAIEAYRRDVSDIVEAQLEWDSTPFLPSITAPTLVIQSEDAFFGDADQARQIAASVVGTRLVTIPGRRAPYSAAGLAAVMKHLDSQSSGFVPRPGLKAVVFTDVVDSTAYTNRVGDEAAREGVRAIEALIADQASANDGRVVKHLGDGSMLVFGTPQEAVAFALAVQAGMAGNDLELRIGMAVGDPVEEKGDLHGAVVNLAARVAAEASPGTVVVSDGTKQLLVGKPFDFNHVGSREVKGFDDPIQVYEVTARS